MVMIQKDIKELYNEFPEFFNLNGITLEKINESKNFIFSKEKGFKKDDNSSCKSIDIFNKHRSTKQYIKVTEGETLKIVMN